MTDRDAEKVYVDQNKEGERCSVSDSSQSQCSECTCRPREKSISVVGYYLAYRLNIVVFAFKVSVFI